jgi:hypothetical protein
VYDLEFSNQLALLERQAAQPRGSFHPDTQLGKSLKLNKLRICQLTIQPYCLKCTETRRCHSLRGRKGFPQSERGLAIGILQNAGQLRKNFIAESCELVLALRAFRDEFFPVTDHAAKLGSSIRRRDSSMYQMQFIGHLRAQFELAIQLVGQTRAASRLSLLSMPAGRRCTWMTKTEMPISRRYCSRAW